MRIKQAEELILLSDNLRVVLDRVVELTQLYERNEVLTNAELRLVAVDLLELDLGRSIERGASIFRDIANARTDGVKSEVLHNDIHHD